MRHAVVHGALRLAATCPIRDDPENPVGRGVLKPALVDWQNLQPETAISMMVFLATVQNLNGLACLARAMYQSPAKSSVSAKQRRQIPIEVICSGKTSDAKETLALDNTSRLIYSVPVVCSASFVTYAVSFCGASVPAYPFPTYWVNLRVRRG